MSAAAHLGVAATPLKAAPDPCFCGLRAPQLTSPEPHANGGGSFLYIPMRLNEPRVVDHPKHHPSRQAGSDASQLRQDAGQAEGGLGLRKACGHMEANT